jgi:hypothetical protein
VVDERGAHDEEDGTADMLGEADLLGEAEAGAGDDAMAALRAAASLGGRRVRWAWALDVVAPPPSAWWAAAEAALRVPRARLAAAAAVPAEPLPREARVLVDDGGVRAWSGRACETVPMCSEPWSRVFV